MEISAIFFMEKYEFCKNMNFPKLQACQQMSIFQWQIATNYAILPKNRPLW